MRYFKIIIPLSFVLLLAGCTNSNSNDQQLTNSPTATTMSTKTTQNLSFPGKLLNDKIENKKAIIKTSKGTMEADLFADKAPLTVSNFVYLASNKFYDGLTFHRVVPDFVIQGGDPTASGAGGPGYKFDDEKVMDEYTDGTLAMANSGPNTNGSQFFICLGDQTKSLTKSYSLFGRLTSGKDVPAKIVQGDKIESITIADK